MGWSFKVPIIIQKRPHGPQAGLAYPPRSCNSTSLNRPRPLAPCQCEFRAGLGDGCLRNPVLLSTLERVVDQLGTDEEPERSTLSLTASRLRVGLRRSPVLECPTSAVLG